MAKKTYGEWIRNLREVVYRPATPLIQRDGIWKLVARYDGWYSLGPKLFDDDLDHLREVAGMVLRERDPQFELPPDERYAAGIHGKVLAHSHLLRKGLAESLALLGSHPKALASCSFGKAEAIARLSVREILSGADWVLWASLNAVLPILAESAPSEFLETVELALQSDPCPFDAVFKQEGGGLTGSTYMTGLLWALETLAWDEAYLTRVVVTLGELAARDPGGNWANRPANSLSTILLPWLPQTCAPIEKRQTAVATLLKEVPAVAWKLLLSLLPSSHEVSHGSHKPTWREMIPDDWSRGVTYKEYWEQVASYAELAITTAKQDTSKLTELIDRLPDLPHPASDQVLAHLQSKTVLEMPEQDRLPLWIELVDLVTKHRRFADAQWAMKPDVVKEIENVAEQLAPGAIFRHQRLFSDRDFELYDEKGNYDEQSKDLEKRREDAVNEVIAAGGLDGVLDFAKTVQSAWRVGFAFGMIAGVEFDKQVLPTLIKSQAKSLEQFSGGFVWGRFRGKDWAWVDSVDTSSWSSSDKGQFLAYLPFTPEAWLRAARILQQDEKEYWSRASVNPYQTNESLEIAVDRLIEYGRPHAAIQCLAKMKEDNQTFKYQQNVRALKAALNSSEGPDSMNADAIVDLIKAMQENPGSSPEDLFQVEWCYLPLLDRHRGGSPKALEQRLADDPAFFCEVVQLVYRSEKEDLNPQVLTEERKAMVTNAYALLRHWRTAPGHQRDGIFNGEACKAWLEKVKEICKESGHLGVALTNIGHVFVYAPSDADGLWLHRSVASALNAKNVDDMRSGFTTELFNLRGVFSWSAGKEESKLAEKYRKQADEVETGGYHRLASSLRKLAASYERDAEREASRDPYSD